MARLEVVGIVGSREWQDLDRVTEYVHSLDPDLVSRVVSGGAYGVDRAAEEAAAAHSLHVTSYRPKETSRGFFVIEIWEDGQFKHTHGRAFHKFTPAAFFRNSLIVRDATRLVAFQRAYSGGTQDSIDRALLAGLAVKTFEED